MKKVRLIVQSGEFVAEVMIPEFLPTQEPDCIIWGSRFFFLKGNPEEYIEGFAIAAVIQHEENVIGDAKNLPSKGNDALLFGLPKTLDEASDDYLTFFSKAKDFDTAMSMKEEEFVGWCHHVSGQYLRNTYFLWWYRNHGCSEWPESKPELVQYFNDLGITHADDMSSMILKTAWRKYHKVPIFEHEQVVQHKNFWKKQGFSDGVFKPAR
jgi:hypothetical protein